MMIESVTGVFRGASTSRLHRSRCVAFRRRGQRDLRTPAADLRPCECPTGRNRDLRCWVCNHWAWAKATVGRRHHPRRQHHRRYLDRWPVPVRSSAVRCAACTRFRWPSDWSDCGRLERAAIARLVPSEWPAGGVFAVDASVMDSVSGS